MIRDMLRFGERAVGAVVEAVSLEAGGVQYASKLLLALPGVPRRAARIVRDVAVALSEIPVPEAGQWQTFRAQFSRVHHRGAD